MWEVHHEWELAPWEPEDNVFLAWAFGEFMDIIQLQALEANRASWIGTDAAREARTSLVIDWRSHLPLLDRQRSELTPELALKRDHTITYAEEAASMIGRAAYSGRLVTRCRHKAGGPLIDIPPGLWGVNDFWPRIATAAFDLDRPFDDTAAATHWIFVDHEGLARMADDLRRQYGQEPIWGLPLATSAAPPPDGATPPDTVVPEPLALRPSEGRRPGGRRRGVGGFVRMDAPIVEKMVEIVRAEKIAPWAAATRLVDQIAGHSNDEQQRVRRVVTRYYERFDDAGEAKSPAA